MQPIVAWNCIAEKKKCVAGPASRSRMVDERPAGPTMYELRSAAAIVARHMTALARYSGAHPCCASTHVRSMHASERHANMIECSRYSGQMRYPLTIRFAGMRKMMEDTESRRCRAMTMGVLYVFVKPMSPSPTRTKCQR
jgi:hypothetical protein